MAAVLTDRKFFDCRTCAAATHLLELNGCTTDAPKPWSIRGVEFARCPRSTFGADELEVLTMREDGMHELPPAEKRRLPAKLAEALDLVDGLLRKEVARHG
jgi:hypothetical protein